MTEKTASRGDKTITSLYTTIIAWGWPLALAMIITPLLEHGLGADAYGMEGLVSTITGYFAVLDLGLNGAGTKYLAEYVATNDRKSIRELIGTTLSLYLFLGVVGCVLIWFIAPWAVLSMFKVPLNLQQVSIEALRVASFGFVFSMLIWWGTSIPTGLQRFDIFNWISVGFGTLTSVGSLAAIWFGMGLIGVVWANVLSNVVAFVAYWFAARHLLPDIPIWPSFDWQMFKRTIKFGLWSVLFRLVGVMVTQLDRIFIGIWLGTAPLTYFIIPSQLASVIQQISGKMMQIVFPMASEFSAAKSVDKLRLLVIRSLNLTTVVAIGLGLPTLVLARPLMVFWMGADFASRSSDLLILLAVFYCLSSLTAAPSSILPGIGKPQVIFYASIISSVFILPAYFLFIRPLGIIGVGWSYFVSAIPVIVYYIILIKTTTGVAPTAFLGVIVRPLVLALGIGFAASMILVPMINNLFGVLLAGGLMVAVYGLGVWFIGVFDSNEKAILTSFILRRVPIFSKK